MHTELHFCFIGTQSVLRSVMLGLKGVLLILLLLSLAACGRSGNVVSKDDSAEYRNAQSLPPLKKPESNTAIGTNNSAAPTQPSTPVVVQQPGKQTASTITTNVIDVGDDQVELEINADQDAAWKFVRKKIGKSDLTVHTRNKSAGRFSIGCSSLEPELPAQEVKKGGWSIFKRDKEANVHCALQLLSAKSSTRVQVLGRDGDPVAADSAREIFARLLNN